MLNTWQTTALLAASALAPTTLASGLRMERRRPPSAPSASAIASLGQLSLTPKQALDADALNVDATQSALLGPHAFVPRPDAATTTKGKISLTSDVGAVAWLADASVDGDSVWAPSSDGFGAGTFTVPGTACGALPSSFSIWGILSQYSGLPYLGLTTYTATASAPATIAAGTAGYAFLTPANQTAARTYAQSATALGSPFTGESAVWSVDCTTKEVTASWTASDGSQVPVAFVQWSADGLVATADVGAFQAQFPGTGNALTLRFEPTSATAFYPDAVKVVDGATSLAAVTATATDAAVPTATATDADADDSASDDDNDDDTDDATATDDATSADDPSATPFSAAAGTVPAATNKAQSKSISRSISKSLSKSKSVSKSVSRSVSRSLSRSKSVSKSVSRSASKSASRAASASASASRSAAKASSSLSKAAAKATLAVRKHAGKRRAAH